MHRWSPIDQCQTSPRMYPRRSCRVRNAGGAWLGLPGAWSHRCSSRGVDAESARRRTSRRRIWVTSIGKDVACFVSGREM
jgi:hypothetical protein